MDSRNRLRARASAIYVIVAFLGVLLIHEYVVGPLLEPAREVPYSQFRQDLAEQRVAEVTVEPERIVYTLKASSGGNEAGRTTLQAMRIDHGDLVAALVASGAEFEARPAQTGLLGPILGWILPILPFALLWWLLMKRMGGGSGGILSVGKSKATEITGEMTGVTFADVAGVDQVEEELKEIIEFLKEPARFAQLGAKLPKGILLVGPRECSTRGAGGVLLRVRQLCVACQTAPPNVSVQRRRVSAVRCDRLLAGRELGVARCPTNPIHALA